MYNLEKYKFEDGVLDINFSVNVDNLENTKDFFKKLTAEEKESIFALIFFLNEAGLITGVSN